jgi:hypothetical protein
VIQEKRARGERQDLRVQRGLPVQQVVPAQRGLPVRTGPPAQQVRLAQQRHRTLRSYELVEQALGSCSARDDVPCLQPLMDVN